MCASFAPDKDSLPGKLALNHTITLKDTWAKETQKGEGESSAAATKSFLVTPDGDHAQFMESFRI